MFKGIFSKYFVTTAITIILCFTFLGMILLVMTANYFIAQQRVRIYNNACNISLYVSNMRANPIELYKQRLYNQDKRASFEMFSDTIKLVDENGTSDIFILSENNDECLLFSDKKEYMLRDVEIVNYKAIEQIDRTNVYQATGTFFGYYGESRYTVGVPILEDANGIVDSQVIGYVFISTPTSSMSTMIVVITRFFLLSVCGVLALSFLFIYMGIKRLTRPLLEMREALNQFSAGNFEKRVRISGNDEISELCISFNTMADALEQMESSRRGFMANISHDLKTPMTTISGFIDGILDGTIPRERETIYLRRVSDEIRRLSRLVDSILDITRLEGGQVEMNMRPLNINEIVKRVLLTFEMSIEEKDIALNFTLDDKIIVLADEDAVYRILTNIIGNSVKYTPMHGGITIETAVESDKFASVKIRNTGPGIAPEEIPFIFDRFYKSDKSRGLDREGMGLGLYIAKMLVNMNRGEIGVESIPGAYTEFTFTLELVKKETGLFTRGDKGENVSKKGDGERPGKLTK